jgi:hypothetical protein
MRNKIEDLRNHLFETLEALKDKESPMDLDRARTISEVAQTIINSAKAETDHLKIVGGKSASGFIKVDEITVSGSPNSNKPRLVNNA